MRKTVAFWIVLMTASSVLGCAKYIGKQVQGSARIMAEDDTINHKEKQKILDMNHTYPKSFVTDLVVRQESDSKISVHYREGVLESAYGSPGADYTTDGKTLKIKILRCYIYNMCTPMVASKADPNGKNSSVTFSIPYNGESIVFIYNQFEEQVTLLK